MGSEHWGCCFEHCLRLFESPVSIGAAAVVGFARLLAPRGSSFCLKTPFSPSSLCRLPDSTFLLPQDFYEDIFMELAQYGEVEYLNVCDNLADHMVGNVYVKFK